MGVATNVDSLELTFMNKKLRTSSHTNLRI